MIDRTKLVLILIAMTLLIGAAEYVDAPAWLAFLAGAAYICVTALTFGEWIVVEWEEDR